MLRGLPRRPHSVLIRFLLPKTIFTLPAMWFSGPKPRFLCIFIGKKLWKRALSARCSVAKNQNTVWNHPPKTPWATKSFHEPSIIKISFFPYWWYKLVCWFLIGNEENISFARCCIMWCFYSFIFIMYITFIYWSNCAGILTMYEYVARIVLACHTSYKFIKIFFSI